MATVRILLGIICLAVFGQFIEPDGYFLGSEQGVRSNEQRTRLIVIALAQVGIREATGKNDGVQVERYLRYTGNKKGAPWCAAFISWVFGRAGHAQPKTAWSPGLFPLARQRINPQLGDVFGIYFAGLGRVAHCGLVEGQRDNWISTIEGNTNVVGSREGDGVYRKLRHKRTIRFYADWLNEPRQEGAR